MPMRLLCLGRRILTYVESESMSKVWNGTTTLDFISSRCATSGDVSLMKGIS